MKRHRFADISPFAVVALAATVAGCGGRGNYTPGLSPGESAQARPQAGAARPVGTSEPLAAVPDATKTHGPLIVVNDPGYSPFGVFGFATSANGNVAPDSKLSVSGSVLDYPQGIGMDRAGYTYVSEADVNGSQSVPYAIAVFAPPAPKTGDKPVRVIEGAKTKLAGEAIAVSQQGEVFVADGDVSPGEGSIVAFEPGASGNVAPRIVLEGARTQLDQPAGVALGKDGDLYVVNLGGTGSPTVTVYAPGAKGNVAPVDHFTLPNGFQLPKAIAVDPSGNVYVASSYNGEVLVYAAKAHMPRAAIGATLGIEPFALAIDAAGYLSVANDSSSGESSAGEVLIFPPNAGSSTKPVAAIAGSKTGLTDVTGIAVPPFASVPTPEPTAVPTATPVATPTPKPTATPTPLPAGDEAVYVADLSSQTLLGFKAGTAAGDTPVVSIAGSNTYFEMPMSAFADAKGNMWVAEQVDSTGSSAVLEFKAGANGNASPIRRIYGQGPNGASDVVVDTAGNIYVLETNESGLAVFAPGANGEASPVRTLTSSALYSPYAEALDPEQKNLYIAQDDANGNPEVLVFPVGAKGNAGPKYIFSNSDAPQGAFEFTGISLDRSGDVDVGASPENASSGAVFEFPAGKTGNVKPSRVLASAGITQPTGVGVDAAGLIYVANYPQFESNTPGTITVYKPGSSSTLRTIENASLKLPGILRVGPYVK